MKKSDIKNLKSKNIAELIKNLRERQELLRAAKFDLAAGKVKNIFFIKDTKKTIARIKTFINLRDKEKSLPTGRQENDKRQNDKK
ncbi:MAG: 50S ribosomal protein L29 [Parcubacteria group bacterium CG1_02_42_13]|nr:MAG: 50S ribosomal protein L29 [Parcubacteria group bacterium CG1_02_42_13]